MLRNAHAVRTIVNMLSLPMLFLAGSLIPGPARADQIVVPVVPAAIQVPAGNVPFLVAHAVGTQNYTCTASGTWGPATPDAQLYGDNGHQIGRHYAGPTWQFLDGSTAVGMKIAAAPSPVGAIPWLLLQIVSTSAGPDGDRLTQTTYIQRLTTTGGTTPGTSCSAGATASVPYTADYYFYRNGN